MLSPIISEADFDRLPEQTQIHYRFCEKCGRFYLSEFKCTCEEE
jgi:hypothetical protein